MNSVSDVPCFCLPYLSAARDGTSTHQVLSFMACEAEAIPADVDAVVITSDLQVRTGGGAESGEDGVQLTERVIHTLAHEHRELSLPPPDRVGLLLAGDLHSKPIHAGRGGAGDVIPLLALAASVFRWVIAVTGNHDLLQSWPAPKNIHTRLRKLYANLQVLDAEAHRQGGVKFAGVCGVIGDPRKPSRRTDHEFAEALDHALRERPDVLLLHQGPHVEGLSRKSSPLVRAALDSHAVPLCICGHDPWPDCLVRLPNGTVILNVDHRVLLLKPGC